MTARTAMIFARVVLGLTALAATVLAFDPFSGLDAPVQPWVPLLHAAVFHVMTLLAFAAFPHSRRNDLAFAIILLGGVLEAAAGASEREKLYHFGADAIGVLVLHASSHVEPLRAAMRDRPAMAAFGHPGDRRATARKPLALVQAASIGWLLVIGIVCATLCPLNLRPRLGDAQLERFGAYFLAAAAFVAACPRRRLTIALASVICAFVLEAGQLLIPGRDARLLDAATKAWGGALGTYIAGMASDAWLGVKGRADRRGGRAAQSARAGRGPEDPARAPSRASSSEPAVSGRPTAA